MPAKTMDLNGFFRALRKTRPLLTWHTRPYGIRANVADGCVCPVTAVYYARTGILIRSSNYLAAAKNLGLPAVLANDIAHAADMKAAPLRKRLIAALALT